MPLRRSTDVARCGQAPTTCGWRRVITTDGSPAWSDLKPAHGVYLKGYREGSDETRVRLLKDALAGSSDTAS